LLHIQILTVGKIKESFIEQGITEYMKRMTAYAKCKVIEVAEEKAPNKSNGTIDRQIKQKEGERLLALVPEDSYVIALAIHGKAISSETFAEQLQQVVVQGYSHFTFIIGGSLGMSDQVLQKAHLLLSFGNMTFPHQLMRLILMEQIYRAMKINRREPYHK
jgi:23S rRNA (pseudouridine1915-N3)-methyltransferase